jgi:hypothetical protein
LTKLQTKLWRSNSCQFGCNGRVIRGPKLKAREAVEHKPQWRAQSREPRWFRLPPKVRIVPDILGPHPAQAPCVVHLEGGDHEFCVWLPPVLPFFCREASPRWSKFPNPKSQPESLPKP